MKTFGSKLSDEVVIVSRERIRSLGAFSNSVNLSKSLSWLLLWKRLIIILLCVSVEEAILDASYLMYPPSSSFEIMLGETLGVETSLYDVENNEPTLVISYGNLNKSSRRALLKKGGHRVRLQSRNAHNQAPQHQKQAVLLRNNTARLTDINNNNSSSSDAKSTSPSNNTELPASRTAPSGSTHFKTTSKKEVSD